MIHRFKIDSPLISEEIFFSERYSGSKLSILVGENGCGKTTILKLIKDHHNFLNSLGYSSLIGLQGLYEDDYEEMMAISGDEELVWNKLLGDSAILDEDTKEDENLELYRNGEIESLSSIKNIHDFSNWRFYKYKWLLAEERNQILKFEFEYQNDNEALIIEIKHTFYENEIPSPEGYILEDSDEWISCVPNYQHKSDPRDFKGLKSMKGVNFRGIKSEVKVTTNSKKKVSANHSNREDKSIIIHTRNHEGEFQIYGTIGPIKGFEALEMPYSLLPTTTYITTKRLKELKLGFSPLELYQYLKYKRERKRYNMEELELAFKQIDFSYTDELGAIEEIKKSYKFITGQECVDFDFTEEVRKDNYKIPDYRRNYLSSGQQQILFLLMQIYSIPARGNHIVIIDEIELSLHDMYLERISKLIKDNKERMPNLLISTHSPTFAGMNIEDSFFIGKKGDNN